MSNQLTTRQQHQQQQQRIEQHRQQQRQQQAQVNQERQQELEHGLLPHQIHQLHQQQHQARLQQIRNRQDRLQRRDMAAAQLSTIQNHSDEEIAHQEQLLWLMPPHQLLLDSFWEQLSQKQQRLQQLQRQRHQQQQQARTAPRRQPSIHQQLEETQQEAQEGVEQRQWNLQVQWQRQWHDTQIQLQQQQQPHVQQPQWRQQWLQQHSQADQQQQQGTSGALTQLLSQPHQQTTEHAQFQQAVQQLTMREGINLLQQLQQPQQTAGAPHPHLLLTGILRPQQLQLTPPLQQQLQQRFLFITLLKQHVQQLEQAAQQQEYDIAMGDAAEALEVIAPPAQSLLPVGYMPVNDRGVALLPYGHLPLIDFTMLLMSYAYNPNFLSPWKTRLMRHQADWDCVVPHSLYSPCSVYVVYPVRLRLGVYVGLTFLTIMQRAEKHVHSARAFSRIPSAGP